MGISRSHIRVTLHRSLLSLIACVMALSLYTIFAEPVKAAPVTIQTGYYFGKGAESVQVSGVGFQPQLVLIRGVDGVMSFATSAMNPTDNGYLSAATTSTTSQLVINSDGFTVAASNTDLNMPSFTYRWIAYTGSDCTVTGSFCVGSYTGNASSPRTITTGFQPTLVIAKSNTADGAHFRTASMPSNHSEFFTTVTADTAGNRIASFTSTGFTVGASDNVNGNVYNYFAFNAGAGVAQGVFTGDGVDNRSITGLGFSPNAVFIKNSNSTTATNRDVMYSQNLHQGDQASSVSAGGDDVANVIQALEADGFQVGTGKSNLNTNTIYWFAFGGDTSPPNASGTFTYSQGSYAGTGVAQSITGLGFSPDLVIVKRSGTAQHAAYKLSIWAGNESMDSWNNGSSTTTTAITTMDADGFSVGTATSVNAAGDTYYWQAFGNAYDPSTNSGAADFTMGGYKSNGIDNRRITGLPFQPDLVVGRSRGLSAPVVFRTSAHVGDSSSLFTNPTDAVNHYQAFYPDGFEVGTSSSVNNLNTVNFWYAFKAGPNLKVGSYTGDGLNNKFIDTDTSPDSVWIKRVNLSNAVFKTSNVTTDTTFYFTSTGVTGNAIKSIDATGFTLGTSIAVNASGSGYRYVAWSEPVTGALTTSFVDSGTGLPVDTPSISMNPIDTTFSCGATYGVIGGEPENVLRIQNTGTNPAWSTSIAPTDGPTALWEDTALGRTYDFNDPTSSGCGDGGDSDGTAGQMTVHVASALVDASPGCNTTGITQGIDGTFSEGTNDAITLLTAGSGAGTGCYWDMTLMDISQRIPAEQLPGDYSIDLTITTVAQ